MSQDQKKASERVVLDRIVICNEVDIKQLTIEWDRTKNENGYEEANKMISERFGGDINIFTVRLGPKSVGNMRVSKNISQWIVNVYI